MAKGKRRSGLPVTRERLLGLLNFDRETGVFTWREDRRGSRGIRKGARAGSVDPNGYRYLRVDGRDMLAQRVAWYLEYGEMPPGIIRFIDGNKDNCAISNLRDASYIQEGKHDWRTKEGKSAQQREYRATISDQLRDYRMRTEFGISLKDYRTMLERQRGVCAICGQPETTKRNGKTRWLAVDHCHFTGKVRGLLCGNCNPMIGYAKDNVAVLEKAIEYLRGYEGR